MKTIAALQLPLQEVFMKCPMVNDSSAATTQEKATAHTAASTASLVSAALAGLLAVGVAGCEDESIDDAQECETNDAGGTTATATVSDAGAPRDTGALTSQPVAQTAREDAGTKLPERLDAAAPVVPVVPVAADAGNGSVISADAASDAATAAASDAAAGPVTLKEIEGNRTYASLKTQCAELGGYVQVHAACSGSNNCKGFSYGDWNPGVLTEHTCASANGCSGLSCVVLPADSGKTGEQVYKTEDLPLGAPSSCLNCHAVWGEKDANGNYPPPDATKFKLWVMPGSTRNAQNWLELSAEAQEAVVAFGRVGVMPDGTAQVSMRGYHQLFSRAEIQRAVQYLRTLTPVVSEIKAPQ